MLCRPVVTERWLAVADQLKRGRSCWLCSGASGIALLQVIVVEDENGNVVRESMKDNDVLMQYKTMREVRPGLMAWPTKEHALAAVAGSACCSVPQGKKGS